MKIYNIHIVKH